MKLPDSVRSQNPFGDQPTVRSRFKVAAREPTMKAARHDTEKICPNWRGRNKAALCHNSVSRPPGASLAHTAARSCTGVGGVS